MIIKQKTGYRFFSAIGLFFALAVLCGFSRAAFAQSQPCRGVSTDKGVVNGVLLDGPDVCAFLGVPYAAPPLGELRFALPAEHTPWTEPRDAGKISAQCPQTPSPMTDTDIPMDEDCLYLNIWQPAGADAKNLPVMVYIHGGGFIVGSGGNAAYNGATLSGMGGVVVVTMNYRLGALGFLAHPAFAGANGRTGNWGLYDQLAALKWVKANIANFGGDPGNVTLFGQSAGGMSVGLQLASPLAAGLFQKVILHSGPPILINTSLAKGRADAQTVAAKLGCGEPATAAQCLRAVDAKTILEKVPLGIFIMDDGVTEEKYFLVPVVDGAIIPDSPYRIFRDGKFLTDVTVMLGTTSDEAAYFTMKKTLREEKDFERNLGLDIGGAAATLGVNLGGAPGTLEALYPISNYASVEKAYQGLICDVGFTCPTELLAGMIAKYQPKVYRFYHTKDPVKIFNWGAFHGAELPYVFGNFTMMGRTFKSKDNLKLAKIVIALWSSFARTGVPAAEGVPEWPLYDDAARSYMTLGDKIEIGANLRTEKCGVMMKLFDENFKE